MHNLLSFDGKTVVLTGAASGIGAATLELLGQTNADVHAIDLAEIEPGNHTGYKADLGDPASVAALIEALPSSVDALLNCAGLPNGGRFTPTQIMAVNWFGLRLLTESLLPGMPPGSAVVHVASTAGRDWRIRQTELIELLNIDTFEDTVRWVEANSETVGDGYAFSKEAVCFYTLRKSADSLEQGVRMNSICPGVTNTPIADDFVAGVGAEVIDRAIQLAGRIAQPHEMAPALLFLADESCSSYISGVNLTVDRGVKAARITGLY